MDTNVNEQPSGKAIAALVFGILSFAGLPCIGALLAIFLGTGEKSGVGRAAVILGWVHLAFMVLVAMAVAFFLLVAAIANHH